MSQHHFMGGIFMIVITADPDSTLLAASKFPDGTKI
jgi:hypothetical protein